MSRVGCQRKITKADDQNKQLTGWLKQQPEWWQVDASDHWKIGDNSHHAWAARAAAKPLNKGH